MPTLAESYAWCQSLSKRTARNFYLSFLTLPADQRRDMCALYAFMRVSDDLGDDESVPIAERKSRLSAWRASVERALGEARFDHVALPAVADLVKRRQIPHEYLLAVIDGVERDLHPAGFETFAELSEYCYHVAGAVGLCCIHLWGFHDPRAPERAVDCGTAFQLTNILRDLGEDAAVGRVYLPREDLCRFHYTADDLAARTRNSAFRELMQFEVARARTYYVRATELLDYLAPAGRASLGMMLRVYGGLLDEIERRDYDVYSRVVRLPRWKKAWLASSSLIQGLVMRPVHSPSPPAS
jgi:phytoene synthase